MKKVAFISFFTLFIFYSLGIAAEISPQIKIVTSKGDIVLELNKSAAPETVKNFLFYANSGFYDNTVFHRVIKKFMIQGGGLDMNMQKKKTIKAVKNEADNGLLNLSGTIAMARTQDPHSATAQFFINVKDNPFLDFKVKTTRGWGYCVFGKVIEGMDVVKSIENVETTTRSGRRDVPKTPVVIKSIENVERKDN